MKQAPNLPVHLMVLILQELGVHDNYKRAAHMRLVSRDWQDAFNECPGSAHRTLLHETDMARLCVLTPSMSRVSIHTRGEPVYFEALADCAQLEKVTLSGSSASISSSNITIDLRGLPRSVTQLAFETDVYLLPESFGSLTGLSIRMLELDYIGNSIMDIQNLLEFLSVLEVRNIKSQCVCLKLS